MFLKKIEMQGFKSFADKIAITLEKGVTSIVGPNGSGKSNISDAVRWVLGEQSVKSLRGSKMDDVIFSGTEHRKPSGFAEVTLLLDNTDGGLTTPYAEVSVTRRIYRSGESEYLINKNLCRLKDVNELFFDTGIGREGYSIISQGKVDEILNNKPEERRGMFEEAAGISKYKARRHEAERKLLISSQNLVRIRDIITELGVQMEILNGQASVARAYLKLRDELKEIEVAGYVASIGKHEASLLKCESGLTAAEEERDRQTAALKAAATAVERIRDRAARIDGLQTGLNKAILDIETRFSQLSNRINLNVEKTSRANADIERVRAEIDRTGERKLERDAELSANRKKNDYLTNESERYEKLLNEKKTEYAAVISTLDESDKAIEALKTEAEEARDKYYDTQNKLSGFQAGREHGKKTAAAVEKNLAAAILETDAGNMEKEELAERRYAASANNETLRGVIKEQTEKRAELEAELNVKKRESDKFSNDLNASRSKLKILTDMEYNFEGFYSSVRRVLTECRRNPAFGAGICGVVASLISVPKDLETAISIALGSAQQNIVTDDEPAAERAIDFLKRVSGGRATFLPVSVINGRSLDAAVCEKLVSARGYIGIASALIGYDEKYGKIIRELLGTVVVADKLENGLAIAAGFGRRFRVVTLEGDIIAAGGAITGGSVDSRDSGIMSRQRQIHEIELSLVEQEKILSGKEQENESLAKALDALSQDILANEKAYNERLIESAALEQKIAHIEDKIKTGLARRELYKLELEESARNVAELDKTINELDGSLKKQSIIIENMQSAIETHSAQNRGDRQNRDALFADISAYNVSVASVAEARKAIAENIARLEGELADGEKGRVAHENAILRYKDEIEKYTAENDNLRSDIVKIEQEKKGANLRIESAAAEKDALRDEERGLADETDRINGLLVGIGREINRFEIRAAKIKAELDHCKNRLWEDYELTVDSAKRMTPGVAPGAGAASGTGVASESDEADEADAAPEAYEADEAPDGSETFDKEETAGRGAGAQWHPVKTPPLMGEAAARRSAKIREEINALSPVNVLSIDEYAQTKLRYEKMEEQSRDLEEASGKLRHIIAEMSQIMRQKFKEQFEIINANFNTVFRELFSGGDARLLLPENADVLDAGIEIEVQLPGKRMQNMMLYSGGERALTAIALIFAMLMLKRPPFCLLDEIESALDEANIERFSRYINKYSDEIQFIMVTHRKGTMEGSNVLYGVTMQERGVSGVVSLRLSDAS